MDYLKNVFEH